jgi:hypothetical protein
MPEDMRRCRELRRYLLAISAAVLLGILIASPPLAYADVVVDDDPNDLVNAAGKLAPARFYIGFVDIIQAGAWIDEGHYFFGMILVNAPSNWLAEYEWVPAFTDSPVHIERVRYQWTFLDSAFNQVGAIRVIFRADLGGEIRLNAMVCVPAVPDLPDQSNADCGPESFVRSLDFIFGHDANTPSLLLAISMDDFGTLFPTAVYWRASASAFLTSMGVAQIRDNAPRALLPEVPEE